MCRYVMTSKVAVAVMLENCTMGVKAKVTPTHGTDGNEGEYCLSAKRAAQVKLNIRIHGRKDSPPPPAQVHHGHLQRE